MTAPKPTHEVKAYNVKDMVLVYGWSKAQLYVEIREHRLLAKKKGGKGYTVSAEDAEAWFNALPDAHGS